LVEGIQSIDRAVAILNSLRQAKPEGKRLAEVVIDTGLQKSTAHRILNALVKARFVDQDEDSGLFHLGPELIRLAAGAVDRYGLLEIANESMLRLAARTGDTVYLSVRSRSEAICIDRVTGSYPIRTLTLEVGDRRPLGVGAGSLALLAWLPDEEVRAIVAAEAADLHRFPQLDAVSILNSVQESRRRGYALNDQKVIAGMSAIGVPLTGRRGRPVAALSLAGITARMDPPRRDDLVSWLREEGLSLEEALNKAMNGVTEANLRQSLPGAFFHTPHGSR
jgi:DNA-binding IclR family transcriptional regulator